MTQDRPASPPTRDDLEPQLWEMTEWRGDAETMDRLLAAIDEYAAGEASLARAELVTSLDDDLEPVPGERDYRECGHELAKVAWRNDVTVGDGATALRLAELSEMFGHQVAST